MCVVSDKGRMVGWEGQRGVAQSRVADGRKKVSGRAEPGQTHHAEGRLVHLVGIRWEIAHELRHRRAQPRRVLRRAVYGYVKDLA